MITGKYECSVDGDTVEALTTFLGVQDPESRRKARKMKRKEAECDNGNDLVDLNDEDSDSAPSSKRQRHQRPRAG